MIMWELKRLVKMQILFAATTFLAIMWFFTCSIGYSYGTNLSEKTALFWHQAGAIFIGFIILLACVPLFTLDYEKGIQDTILATKKGRRKLAFSRFAAVLIFCLIYILVTTCISIIPALIYKSPVLWFEVVLRAMIAALGVLIFCAFCSGIADLSKSRAITLTVCGLCYAFPFIIREIAMSDKFWWFLKHGLFSDVVRANGITREPTLGLAILVIWYTTFILLEFWVVIQKRQQRSEW